ncbi:MAG TPA: hypothetical protein DDW52_27305 [Planctomycetaceae bacterium]|nr:hypothetical protein [Planctomycetaceae bacterium]
MSQIHFQIAFAAISFPATVIAYAQPPTEKQSEMVLTFLSHRSGENLLYAAKPDGTDPLPIFGGPVTDIPSFNDSYVMFREPHWTRQSPDGTCFASWVYETGKPLSEYRGTLRPVLVVGDLAGTWTRIVSPDSHEEFAWSPDSKQIAYSVLSRSNYHGILQNRPVCTEIFVSGIDGSNFNPLFEQKGNWIVLDWSPDGKRLLIARREFAPKVIVELFEFQLSDALLAKQQTEYDPEWTVKTALQFLKPIDLGLGDLQVSSARYSPTRSEIAIEAFDPQNMYAPNMVGDDELSRGRMMRLLSKIFVFDLDTASSHKVADYEDGIRGPICWSPDGNDVLFSRYLPKGDDREKFAEAKEHGLSIWSVSRDGSNARFVTTGWSPDLPHSGLHPEK